MSERVYDLQKTDAQLEVRIDDDFPPLDEAVSIDLRHPHDGGYINLTLDEAESLGQALILFVAQRRRDIKEGP